MEKVKITCSLFYKLFKIMPVWILWQIICEILYNVIIFITFTYSTQYVLSIMEKSGDITQIYHFMTILAVASVIVIALREVHNHIFAPKMRLRFDEIMKLNLMEKTKNTDLAIYDTPEFRNCYTWLINNAQKQFFDLINVISNLFGTTAIVLMTGGIVLGIDITVAVFIALSVVGMLFLQSKSTKLYNERSVALTPYTRKTDYIKRIFNLAEYAKDLRSTDLGQYMENDFSKTIDETISVHKKYGKTLSLKSFHIQFTAGFFPLYILYIGFLLIRSSVYGNVSVETIAAALIAIAFLSARIVNLSGILASFGRFSFLSENLKNFMEKTSTIETDVNTVMPPGKEIPPFEYIEFENVYFSYKSEEEPCTWVLKNIDIRITKNEMVAFVGLNGAGKSTVMKLLMRLYDPVSGQIKWNGMDIKCFNVQKYRKKISTIFQEFQIYAYPLENNVSLSSDADEEYVKKALKDALWDLPFSLKNYATKEFDDKGFSLSGGQSQKLAIARAFYHKDQILLFDEPCSNLDPIAEAETYKHLSRMSKEHTVIFSAHRLTAVRECDKIYFIENGTITESGRHTDLMNQKGSYANLFNTQVELYSNYQHFGNMEESETE